jgi:lipopolysaccharide export LptBFGC system permease protein LptF
VRAARAEFLGRERWGVHAGGVRRLDPHRPADPGILESHVELELEIGSRRTLLEANPEMLALPELREYGQGKAPGSAQALQALSLIHERLTNPLATLPFVVLATALGLRVERTRSLARSALPGVLAILVFLLVRHYAGMLSRQGIWGPMTGAWGSLLLFALAAGDQLRRVPR